MSVLGMVDTTERPPLARFERRGVEDRNASIREGRYIEKDVDMALVTPAGSRDVFIATVTDWFTDLKKQVRDQRLPQTWLDRYEEQYKRWKQGEELPLDGTPIKGWGVLSPAQQKNLISLNILTVEDLGKLNDEGMRRIGMGANDLKNKAIAWLRQLDDRGGLTQENAALKAENEAFKKKLDELTQQVEALMDASVRSQPQAMNPPVTRSSVIDEEDDARNQYIAKFGKAPHHKMKLETILDALKG